MRALLLVLFLASGCATIPKDARVPLTEDLKDVPPATLEILDAAAFAGTWYVVATNFAYWQTGDRTDVSFVYTPVPHDEHVALDDQVLFKARGKDRRFWGFDLQDPTRLGHFQWRGHGALRSITNQWYVVALDPGGAWAVIYFSKSNVGTGQGLEIITRERAPSDAVVAAAVAAIRADADLLERAADMVPVPQEGRTPDWDLP